MNTEIKKISGYQLFDSRANPTVAACVELECGARGFFISPSGASTGEYEAYELRDGDKNAFFGRGVVKAVEGINGELCSRLSGMDAADQKRIDAALMETDGTENKSRLGANAVLAVSFAAARAAAEAFGLPLYRYIGGISGNRLPVPMMNILNGGAHAANNIDIQEFMIVPIGAETTAEAMKLGCEVYHTLGRLLREKKLLSGVGDEGGYAPMLSDDEQALCLITEAIEHAGYTGRIKIALDIAASEWATGDGLYKMPKSGKTLTSGELTEWYGALIKKYPVTSIEDGLGENDWSGWRSMTSALENIDLVGDDLFVTNKKRLRMGIEGKSANSILIKPNQIGTLSETLDVIKLARRNGYQITVSHRSGETEDTSIADLAVAVNADRIKTGAPARSERVAKYNRLLMIEQELRA